MSILKLRILYTLPFHKANLYGAYTAILSVCPLASAVEPDARLSRLRNFLIFDVTTKI